MKEVRNIAVDVTPFFVEMTIEDFEYLIDAALAHEDTFFENLYYKLAECRKKQDEEAPKG